MIRYVLFSLFFVIAGLVPLGAQTADELEKVLAVDVVTWNQAARFVLEAAEKAALADPEAAFLFAAGRGWLPKNAVSGDAARLDGISLLLARSFGIRGGIFYSLFHNAHYAYRELIYQNILQAASDPGVTITGEYLLFLIGRFLSIQEAEAVRQGRGLAEEAARLKTEREVLAEEINVRLEAQEVADTRASATREGVTISLSNIQFLADSAILLDSEKLKLDQIADILRGIPGRRILIVGHSALADSGESQVQVSRERAQAVAAYLLSLRVRESREITARGYGASVPVATNSTPEGRALNRRVEIILIED